MYKPKIFSEDRAEVLQKFIQEHPLATLITSGSSGIMANLIPMNFHRLGEMGTLRCHLARANPQIERITNGDEILLLFNGPQSYISPEMYATKKIHRKVVPTWNYSMVQVKGTATIIDDPRWVLEHIKELTNSMEASNESPWKVEDAPADYILGQLKAIVGIEILIESMDGKFKVSQNQSAENQNSVKEALLKRGEAKMARLVENRGPSRGE